MKRHTTTATVLALLFGVALNARAERPIVAIYPTYPMAVGDNKLEFDIETTPSVERLRVAIKGSSNGSPFVRLEETLKRNGSPPADFHAVAPVSLLKGLPYYASIDITVTPIASDGEEGDPVHKLYSNYGNPVYPRGVCSVLHSKSRSLEVRVSTGGEITWVSMAVTVTTESALAKAAGDVQTAAVKLASARDLHGRATLAEPNLVSFNVPLSGRSVPQDLMVIADIAQIDGFGHSLPVLSGVPPRCKGGEESHRSSYRTWERTSTGGFY